jgi:FixJ family two-component response regulator
MISGHGTIDTAVSAIKSGAYDFVEKPFKADRLLVVVDRAIEADRLRRENAGAAPPRRRRGDLRGLLERRCQRAQSDREGGADRQPRARSRALPALARRRWRA